jgi:hypothetical protein
MSARKMVDIGLQEVRGTHIKDDALVMRGKRRGSLTHGFGKELGQVSITGNQCGYTKSVQIPRCENIS